MRDGRDLRAWRDVACAPVLFLAFGFALIAGTAAAAGGKCPPLPAKPSYTVG